MKQGSQSRPAFRIQRAGGLGLVGHSGGQVGMGSSKRLECDAGAASWIANMLAVASASQKDSLNFFILVLLFFWISGTLKGPWFNNLGSHISKNAAIHAPGLKD